MLSFIHARSEAKLVEAVVEDIITKLRYMSKPSDNLKTLVRIEKRIKEIESLLLRQSWITLSYFRHVLLASYWQT